MNSDSKDSVIEDFKRQLPEYLSLGEKKRILEALKSFPDSFNPYSTGLGGETEQGDVFSSVPVYFYNKNQRKNVAAMVVSNACDISPSNQRNVSVNAVVATVFSLKGYQEALKEKLSNEKVENVLKAIKGQEVTNLFYLPKHPNCHLLEDSVVRFDTLTSIPLDIFLENRGSRLVRLSLIGYYLFLFKLSVHFCRFPQEKTEHL